jgi:hypothetical protein
MGQIRLHAHLAAPLPEQWYAHGPIGSYAVLPARGPTSGQVSGCISHSAHAHTAAPALTLLPPNKRLKLTGHRALQISVLPSGRETKRFQLSGHRGRQLSREPLGGQQTTRRRLS